MESLKPLEVHGSRTSGLRMMVSTGSIPSSITTATNAGCCLTTFLFKTEIDSLTSITPTLETIESAGSLVHGSDSRLCAKSNTSEAWPLDGDSAQ